MTSDQRPLTDYSLLVHLRERLVRRASKAGVSIAAPMLAALEAYFELLRKWNRKVSLTALPVEEIGDEAIDRLLVEPLLASRHITIESPVVIDVGSGGGSPAIPLKIAIPSMSLRMVESKTRKAAFLREAVRTLELSDAFVESVRLEELFVRPLLHESADVVTLRAVRLERKLLAGIHLFLKPVGRVFLFTSDKTAVLPHPASHFTHYSSEPLLRQWGSRLEILQKK